MTRFPMRAHRTFAPEAISVSQARAVHPQDVGGVGGWGTGRQRLPDRQRARDERSGPYRDARPAGAVAAGPRPPRRGGGPASQPVPALHRRPGAGDRRARAGSPDHHVALVHVGRRVHPDGQAGVGVVLERRRPAPCPAPPGVAPVGRGQRTWRSSRSRRRHRHDVERRRDHDVRLDRRGGGRQGVRRPGRPAGGGAPPEDLGVPAGPGSWQGTYTVLCSDGTGAPVFASHRRAVDPDGTIALLVPEEQRALLELPRPPRPGRHRGLHLPRSARRGAGQAGRPGVPRAGRRAGP